MAHQPLDDLELETLEDFLESDQVHPECHNFITAHGFLTALSICPVALDDAEWLAIVFEETPAFKDKTQEEKITKLLIRFKRDIEQELESEEDFLVPCEIEMSEDPELLSELQEWASGFMEGVFLTETHWFESEKEDIIAELLLPIMVASDLFDDEEVLQIRNNSKLTQSCIEQIPDVVTDLFLVLRTEVEKKTPKTTHSKKRGNQKKRK